MATGGTFGGVEVGKSSASNATTSQDNKTSNSLFGSAKAPLFKPISGGTFGGVKLPEAPPASGTLFGKPATTTGGSLFGNLDTV